MIVSFVTTRLNNNRLIKTKLGIKAVNTFFLREGKIWTEVRRHNQVNNRIALAAISFNLFVYEEVRK